MSEKGSKGSLPPKRSGRRWLRRLGYVMALFGVVAGFLLVTGWTAFGKGASGPRLERMRGSPQWLEPVFENPQPLWNDTWGGIAGIFRKSDHGSPSEPLPVVKTDPALFKTPPASGLRVTWLGHSTLLIEIDGKRLLTDPVWGERTSPFSYLGPSRWYPPPIRLEDLPPIDAVLLSHDHYDHLDAPTIQQIAGWDTTFLAPLGVGAHLEYWGVPAARIVDVDWWQEHQLGELKIVCVPARHASGRHLLDQNSTLWGGYALVGPTKRAYFSGDTGMFPALSEIGSRLGPFDVTMIEVGAYDRAWPDWHLGPEQAIEAHKLVRGKTFIPVHWGLFDLSLHGWTEPVERTFRASEQAKVRALVPRPGGSVEPDSAVTKRWWPEVPWQTAEEHPIEARGLGGS